MSSYVEKRFLAGIVMLTVGVILMLRYYNILPELPYYLFTWKTLLIVIGMVFLITDRNHSTGLILIVVGSVFFATDVFNMTFRDVVKLTIPIILIVIGLFLILRRQTYKVSEFSVPVGEDSNDFINDVSIFGGGEKKIRSMSFKGGRLTAIFGGSDIDLRQSVLAPGVNAIDVMCLFGGVTLRVPDDWKVKNDVTAIFGGFSDKRFIMDKPSQINTTPEKILYIKGLVIFGGGEIK